MPFRGFEGPAGTGKTHELIGALRARVVQPPLAKHQRALALTFMHGSRRRLDERLNAFSETRGRSVCSTIDSFAGNLVQRWQSSLTGIPALSEFDQVCDTCGLLLERPDIARWVARTYPVIVVDEAQELRPCRLRIIKALSAHTDMFIAADEFQCLDQETDSGPFLEWFHSGNVQPLTIVRRTTRPGLLNGATALRGGAAPSNGVGLSIRCEFPAQAPFAIGHVLNAAPGSTVVLVGPGASDWAQTMIPRWLDGLQTPRQTVPALKIGWETNPARTAATIATAVSNGGVQSNDAILAALASLEQPPAWVRAVVASVHAARRALGRTEWSESDLAALFERKASAHSAFGRTASRGIPVMTIQAAKNRQFRNVVVLWAHSPALPDDYKRRLLYNAITRAEHQCTVFVRAQDLLNAAPFT